MISSFDYSYDATGNLQLEREPGGGRATYTWDAENHLTLSEVPVGIVNTMTYRADGLRIEKQDSSGTSKFIWDGQNILTETDVSDTTQATYTLKPSGYGNLISQRRGADSHFFHFDGLGSTDRLTDASQEITDNYCYLAYGQLRGSTGTTVNPFRWVGRLGYFEDIEMDQYYVRARHYSPLAARWLSQDPIGFQETLNLYNYVGGHVTALVDPNGEGWLPLPSGPGHTCHGNTYYWAKIAWILKKVWKGGLLAPTPSYKSMPFMHCVWNCVMTGMLGKKVAKEESAKKEAADVEICKLGHGIGNNCWMRLSKKLRNTFARVCCSAEQTSDYKDNATGRACACAKSYWTATMAKCRECCTEAGVGANTPDGPNDPVRPCGPHFNNRDREAYDENPA